MSKKKIFEHSVPNTIQILQRLALGFMPGGHVVDEFLNFRSNLKRDRILSFSNSLNEFLKDFKHDELGSENFTTEEFIDIFDSVISKVQITSSNIKLEYFRNIILSQITDSSANEILSNKVIQTVDNLNDIQLILLMIVWEQKTPSTIYDIHMKFQMKNVYIKLNENDNPPDDIKIENTLESSIFLYFLDELTHMGLIKEYEIGGEERVPTIEMRDAYQNYIMGKKILMNSSIIFVCTSYGKLICNFIKTPSSK